MLFFTACDVAAKVAPDLQLYLGCEFHANMEMTEILAKGERPTMAGSRYVLTEFKESSPYSFVKERVTALRSAGYRPIIAHAERYECLRKGESYIEELVDMGARIQMNAGSILGDMGFSIRQYCRKLLKLDLVHYIGTDAHNMEDRQPNLGKCADWLEKKMGYEYTKQLLIDNPSEIVLSGRKKRGG